MRNDVIEKLGNRGRLIHREDVMNLSEERGDVTTALRSFLEHFLSLCPETKRKSPLKSHVKRKLSMKDFNRAYKFVGNVPKANIALWSLILR